MQYLDIRSNKVSFLEVWIIFLFSPFFGPSLLPLLGSKDHQKPEKSPSCWDPPPLFLTPQETVTTREPANDTGWWALARRCRDMCVLPL